MPEETRLRSLAAPAGWYPAACDRGITRTALREVPRRLPARSVLKLNTFSCGSMAGSAERSYACTVSRSACGALTLATWLSGVCEP